MRYVQKARKVAPEARRTVYGYFVGSERYSRFVLYLLFPIVKFAVSVVVPVLVFQGIAKTHPVNKQRTDSIGFGEVSPFKR